MLNGDPGHPPGRERISYGLAVVGAWVVAAGVVAGCVVADGVVAGWVVADGVVADWEVADGVVAGWAVAGGWLVEGAGDGTAGETAAGVPD